MVFWIRRLIRDFVREAGVVLEGYDGEPVRGILLESDNEKLLNIVHKRFVKEGYGRVFRKGIDGYNLGEDFYEIEIDETLEYWARGYERAQKRSDLNSWVFLPRIGESSSSVA
jgi:hypothetical protein